MASCCRTARLVGNHRNVKDRSKRKQHQGMDYELAEQLREAGFPQSGEGKRIGTPSALVWRARDLIYVPTLEELISAW